MDRKSIIILAAAVGVYLLLTPVVNHFFPDRPMTAAQQAALHPTPPPTHVPSSAASPTSPTAPAPMAAAGTESSTPEQILTVSNADLIWRFTSRGGGIKDVDLTHYPAVIRPPGQPTPQTNRLAGLNHNAPLPVLAVMGSALDGDGDFALSRDGDTIRAEKTLSNGLRVVKEFEISTNYLFKARVRLENTSGQPLHIPDRDVIVGTATAIGPLDDPTVMGAFWYNGLKSQNIQDKWFANRTLGCIPGTPRWQYEEGASNVVWSAIHNQFFALAAIPSNPAPQIVIDKIGVPPPDLSGLTNAISASLTNGYQTALVYPAEVLAPHQSVETAFQFYAGPKEYKRLAEIAQNMGNNLDLIMDFTGVWGFFSKFLLLAMNGLHDLLRLNYGLTIIAITIIIKGIFWPLTIASTKSQKRMQALQPQLKAIAEKYKDDAGKKKRKDDGVLQATQGQPAGQLPPDVAAISGFPGVLLYVTRRH